MTVVLWIIVAFTAGIVEMCTTALVSVWFAVGAVCAAVAAGLGFSESVQIIAFLLVSALTLTVTFPICKKMRVTKKVPTNADRLIGCIGVITEDVDPIRGKGEVNVCGQRWSVQVRGEDAFAKSGTKVRVEEISGAHLVVTIVDDCEKEREEL